MSRVGDCAIFLAGMVCAACVPREPDPVVVAQRAIERSNSGSHTVAMAMLLPAEIESAARSGTTIVDLLVHRVPNFRLTRANRVACPHIVLRGLKSVTIDPNPDIYVDGARMQDTYILDTLSLTTI